jgi:tRNA-Thr(GGU) m(6)t(6)A37 methyltransferase TsaA
MMPFERLGVVHSCFSEKFGTPRQANIVPSTAGYIEIESRWTPEHALQGLETFSHLWVVFWFHGHAQTPYRPKVHPPRLAGRCIGTLASRSPIRPNPIGMSLVKIDRIEGARIYISGLDMIDGTPVIDIKPYIHAYDHAANSSSGWLEPLQEKPLLPVSFSPHAITQAAQHPDPNFKETLRRLLETDIRNPNDRRPKNEGKTLGFYYEDFNIVFQVIAGHVHVLAIDPSDHRQGGSKILRS